MQLFQKVDHDALSTRSRWPHFNSQVFALIKEPENKRDYLKLVVLINEGGVYVANDYVCLKHHGPLFGKAAFVAPIMLPKFEFTIPLISTSVMGVV